MCVVFLFHVIMNVLKPDNRVRKRREYLKRNSTHKWMLHSQTEKKEKSMFAKHGLLISKNKITAMLFKYLNWLSFVIPR